MGRGKDGILTALQMKFVEAFDDTATDAARKIGCKNPKQSAYALMKNPNVQDAIRKKQEERRRKAVEQFVKAVAKADVVAGIMLEIKKLSDWRDTLLAKKKLTAAEQNILVKVLEAITSAYHEIGTLQGYVISRSFSLDKMLEGRTEEEKEYFAVHGYWPEMESEQSGSRGSKSPGQNRHKPN